MRKQEFLANLRARLSGLPKKEIEERLSFYSEMIDDRMEEGASEESAVAAVGSLDEVSTQVISEVALYKIITEKIRPKRKLKGWEITLLVLGFPVWFPLLAAAFAVGIALYAVLLAIVVSLWACFGAVVGCGIGGILGGAFIAYMGTPLPGIALIGAGLVCLGISIFLFFACKALTKGASLLAKKTVLKIMNSFMKKEA